MTAKQYLGQLQVLDTKINQKLEELTALKIDARYTSGIDYSKDRVQTSGSGDTVGNAVVRYVSLANEINAEIDSFADAKHQIVNEIQSLNADNYIKVLFKIYVQFKSIRAVADDMSMSYPYVIELHKKALKMFEEHHENLQYLT